MARGVRSVSEGVGIGGAGKRPMKRFNDTALLEEEEDDEGEEEDEDIPGASCWEIWYIGNAFEYQRLFFKFIIFPIKWFLILYVLLVLGKLFRYTGTCAIWSDHIGCPTGIPTLNDFYIISTNNLYNGDYDTHSLFDWDMVGTEGLLWIGLFFLVRYGLVKIFGRWYLNIEELFKFWNYPKYYMDALNRGKRNSLARKKVIQKK